MGTEAESTTYRHHEIVIEYDECGESPRDWDNICELHYCSNRYYLGDKEHNHEAHELREIEAEAERQGDMVFPYYAYIHGGVTVSMSPFSCPWDSGQCGVIIVRRKKMLEEFGGKRWTKALREKALLHAKSELETFDKYLRGEVYGYIIDGDGDSCWGYYSIEDAMTEAKSTIDYMVQQARKAYVESILNLVRTRRLVL
jgi:hypothetical protein